METELSQDWVGAQATAAELLRQQACREPFHALTPPFAIQTLEQAYASQKTFVQQQAAQRNTQLGGYKIAITTPAMRNFVGFDDAISGCVLADTVFASGHRVQAAAYQHLIVEFELALQSSVGKQRLVRGGRWQTPCPPAHSQRWRRQSPQSFAWPAW